MIFLKTQRFLGLAFLSATLLLAYTNCAGPLSSSVPPEDQSSLGQDDMSLKLSPQAATLNFGETTIFEANGGVPPYSYTIISGGGTLGLKTGHYRAPNYEVTSVIQVRDDAGEITQATAYVSFKSTSAITLTTNPVKVLVGTVATLTATGGTAPYTYQMIAGVGTITANKFQSAAAGTATIGIVDAKGMQNSVTLQVSNSTVIETLQIYRWYNATARRSYYTKTKVATTGWASQGAAFKVIKNPEPRTVLLVRCKRANPETFFVSSSGSCSGYMSDAPLGYIYTEKLANTLELLHCFNSGTGDYLATTSATACAANGYARLGRHGFVPK